MHTSYAHTPQSRPLSGFTIVELLVVIVVIAILAAITIVAYRGISQQAIASSLSSDLDNASKQLKLYQIDHSAFPTANDCSATPAANTICLKSSNGASYAAFQINNTSTPQTFCLTALKGGINYRITNDSTPVAGTCSGILASGDSCPTGFIVVPGNPTFNTNDFCVMKYEAKQVGSTAVPVSQASGTPWVSITQTAAITNSSNVAGCTGCHLITDAEWMTIASNVIGVASNWTGGTIGGGSSALYSGHNDSSPNNALAADTDDTNGYSGTGNSSPSNQRRTLTLSNGEVIWDLSGNVGEWTSTNILGGQQPGLAGDTGYAYREYNNPSLLWNGLSSIDQPATAYPGASTWSHTQGIGQLNSYYGETGTRSLLRSGTWSGASGTGVLALNLNYAASAVNANVGFRVAR